MDPTGVLIWLGVYLSGIGVMTWAALRRKLPPIEPNAPRERPERAVYTLADRVLDWAAKQYALVVDVDVARGKVDGNQVRIEVTPFGSAEPRLTRFKCSVHFKEPLELELQISPRRSRRAANAGHREVISLEFDELYEVDALHLDQARALISGSLEAALIKAHRTGWQASLDDEALVVSVAGDLGEVSVVKAIDWMIDVSRKMAALRGRVGLPELETEWKSAWKRIAQANSARFEVRSKSVRVELERGRIGARLERSNAKSFAASIAFELARPLPYEIALSPESERTFVERWRNPDIELGDASFDAAFVVRGEPADEVKKALSVEARQALLDLAGKSRRLTLDSTRVELLVEPAITDPDELGQLVSALLRAIEALAPKTEKSAYR